MANILVTTAVTTQQVIGDGETGLVTESGAIFVPGNTTGIQMTGTSTLTMEGSIVAGFYGITHLDSGADVMVHVGATGTVRSIRGDAVYLIGETFVRLFNQGTILGPMSASELTSEPTAAYLRATPGGKAEVINQGTMWGDFSGLYLDSTSSSHVTNSGTISGFHGIYVDNRFDVAASDTAQVIWNSGTIDADFGYAYHGGNWVDRITNTGTIDGYVSLNDGDDRFDGRNGIQTGLVDGGSGEDVMLGGIGDDSLLGGHGNDTLRGGAGEDDLRGDDSNDVLYGGLGDDVITGDGGDDLVQAGAGDDLATGGTGNDTLNGQDGNDTLNGNAGNDILRAGGGESNRLMGAAGDDTLISGSGMDALYGNGGRDVFVFTGDDGFDQIMDFTNGLDLIDLSAFGLSSFGAVSGALSVVNPSVMRLDLDVLGGSGSVLIRGLSSADVDSTDFIL